ncbi:peptidoglycan DD-metalloendopeptidase family protein [Neobacillus sp. DY30]|uniref:murein hydrolase activator EnvC family protein n=1 Tax=Neobacillus sp. DY30 TaxID=3047871 RepID=UPI0024C031D2|nr:peptidoglycan DD-metalloendopeptidase family protein [Neobacillus sp. DY30]WHX99964.1 peptidoglycan DD-metalloendopeptidase family protein [Neobacillus sp. DY30]
MKKPILTFAVAGTITLTSFFGGFAEAASLSSLRDQQNKIEKEKSELNSTINNADQQINSLNEQQSNVKAEMTRLDLSIDETHRKISEKTAELEKTEAEIKRLQEEIKVTKERIEKRNELLKERARNYQETGGLVSYIDVLMGSQNFSDFIDRASAVATIMQADQDILKQHEADKKSLEENQAKLEVELASVQTILDDLEKMKQQLNAQRAEKDRLLASLEKQEEEIHEHKMELQEEAQLLAAQSSALQKAIALEQKHQEEAAAAAAAQAAAAAAAANNNAGSGNGGGGSTSPQPSAPQPSAPVSSGAFTLPANGTFTSSFAPRWGSFHYGVDIANRAANVPVWAAADGVVIQSYYSSSYGNVVFIAHSINGQTYTTVSAHLETRNVSSGAVVKKGQQIGIMGNTGDSQGKHLHFELHRGQWNASKSNAINPVGIVPMP